MSAGNSGSSVVVSSGTSTVACAFLGLLDIERREAGNDAYSPAGTNFQESMLDGLNGTLLDVTQVVALRPVSSFPRCRKLFFGTRRVSLFGRIKTVFLPFVNFGALKTVTSGIALVPYVLFWAWQERNRPRALLLYNVTHPPAAFALLAARLTGSIVVALVADIQVPGEGLVADSSLRRLEYKLQTKTLPYCDGLVVLTRKMADDFAPETPYIEMEGAVPAALVADAPASRRAPASGEIVLMYAGGLSELKGIPLLLAAFSRLREPSYRLWITGRGPLEALVAEAAAHDDRIIYHGFPEAAVLRQLYTQADVLVNPHSASQASARYLFPSKLIEYLATGTPVISTPSTPEVAEQYGRVAEVMVDESVDAMVVAIARIARMTAAERQAMGARARDFVLREKSWRTQAGRIADFTVSLAMQRGPR